MADGLRVLIVGATGVFGSRLAERLVREDRVEPVLAARGEAALRALAQRLGGCTIRLLDRNSIAPADLKDIDLVIDAAGPFQGSGTQVIDAALASGVDYADLADGRQFVGSIGSHDAAAKRAGIAILSGVSSIPALSHAVLDRLTAGWPQVDTIRLGIFPGNHAPRGRAVVEAILSYAGKPVRVFRDGQWGETRGWGETHRWVMPDGSWRWASVCDTPDQDLLVERYAPVQSAEFFAGVELSILHLGLASLSQPVRWGLIGSLVPAAGLLLWIARRFLPFGSDVGWMDVRAEGKDRTARWTLRAEGNRGPYVPVLAAVALVRRYRDGQRPAPGASACAGLLRLDEFEADFADLGIETRFS